MPQADEVRNLFSKAQQGHVFEGWDELSESEQESLLGQCSELDLDLLAQLWRNGPELKGNEPSTATSLQAAHFSPLAQSINEKHRQIGESLIRSGAVGVVIVAGGQGTRLGFDRPKGLYPIGPVSNRNLFEFILDRIDRRTLKLRAPSVPVWVMTSDATHEATVEYFEDRYSRWPSLEVNVFRQGLMPAVDASSGKILLSAQGTIAMSPDGHGGMVQALAKRGALERLAARGVSTLFYCQIDNPMVDALSPELIGAHVEAQSQMTTLVVRKSKPEERVGNVAMFGDRMAIIEYSDISPEDAKRTQNDGSFVFWAGNTGIHLFDRAFLEESAASAEALPFHWARKKVAWWSRDTGSVEPAEPNAIKFERFIFDLMPSASRTLAVEIDAADYFAPVKNASGSATDSPETCKGAILQQSRRWLGHAQVAVPAGLNVEIGPAFAVDPADLCRQREKVRLNTEGDQYLV